jgi:hypothetical protein
VEFVAFRVAAEVVVVLQDQDASVRAEALAVVVRRGQAADTAANDHEIVRFVEVRRGREGLALSGQRVRHFERAGVRATHAGAHRRVIGGRGCRDAVRCPGG